MAMVGSKMYVEGVELNRMGQNMHLARYPIHWHLIGDAQGQYIKNSAIHDTYSRCVTVHGTNYLDVENNVTYNNIGHCFFLEDGVEHGNQFVHNLGILTKCHPDAPCVPTNLAPFGSTGGKNFNTAGQNAKDVLIPSDNTASTFWITNPDNIYRDNVAAGSDATGFWFALPEHPTGKFEGTEISAKTWPRRTQVREFKGNTAHSNFDGFMFDRGPRPDGHFAVGGHISLANPADANSPQVESVFEDFTSYKNRNGGIWARGEMHTVQEPEAGRQRHRLHACVRQLRSFRLYVTGGGLAVRGRNREHRQPQDAGGNGLRPQLAGARSRGFPDPRLRVLRLPS